MGVFLHTMLLLIKNYAALAHIDPLNVCILSIQTPQTPMVRPYAHDHYKVDNYPQGTNAIVCVISYTVSRICRFHLIEMCSRFVSGLRYGRCHDSE